MVQNVGLLTCNKFNLLSVEKMCMLHWICVHAWKDGVTMTKGQALRPRTVRVCIKKF
jgi:hypothetical protein